MSIAGAVNAWYAINRRDLPWRREGFTAWGVMVSEFMLQQTPVARVIPRLEEWLARWPTASHLAAATAGDAVRAWGRLGYPRRALNLHAAAVAITERHGGVVPDAVPELLALPGVGDYTARAIAAFAYGHRHPVVDINVRRVLARSVEGRAEPGPASGARDLAAMDEVIPRDLDAARITNAAVMELGAMVCTARAPLCGSCPIAGQCAWRAAGFPPFDGKRAPVQKRFDGSDRQVRGIIMAEMRARYLPLAASELSVLWPDQAQLARALDGLIADQLVTSSAETGFELPV